MKRKSPSPGQQRLNRKTGRPGRAASATGVESGRAQKAMSIWWSALLALVVVGSGFWMIREFRRQPWVGAKPSTEGEVDGRGPDEGRKRNAFSDGHSSRSLAPAGAAKETELVDQIHRANQMVANGRFREAVELFKEAEKTNTDDEDVHYNLGIALAGEGKNEEAIRQYEKALRIFPDYAEAHNNLGNLLLRTGQGVEALLHFERAVKITPDYASAWNNFGTALRQLGRTNEAFGFFQEAVRLDTNDWRARFNLGTSHVEHGRANEARVEFQAVLRLEPDFAPAKFALTQLEPEPESAPVPP